MLYWRIRVDDQTLIYIIQQRDGWLIVGCIENCVRSKLTKIHMIQHSPQFTKLRFAFSIYLQTSQTYGTWSIMICPNRSTTMCSAPHWPHWACYEFRQGHFVLRKRTGRSIEGRSSARLAAGRPKGARFLAGRRRPCGMVARTHRSAKAISAESEE